MFDSQHTWHIAVVVKNLERYDFFFNYAIFLKKFSHYSLLQRVCGKEHSAYSDVHGGHFNGWSLRGAQLCRIRSETVLETHLVLRIQSTTEFKVLKRSLRRIFANNLDLVMS